MNYKYYFFLITGHRYIMFITMPCISFSLYCSKPPIQELIEEPINELCGKDPE